MGTISAIKLKRTDTTLDLSHNGKGSWRKRKVKIRGESEVFCSWEDALAEVIIVRQQQFVCACSHDES